MPNDDLVLNVRQIAGYPPASSAIASDFLVLQRGGLGGPYISIDAADFVGTALSDGGDMVIGGGLSVVSLSGGSAQLSNLTTGVFGAQRACIGNLALNFGSINGDPILTASELAAFAAQNVRSFNMRFGDIMLTVDDIVCAGGAPLYSPRFQGSPRAETPPPWSNSSRLATTAFVQMVVAGLIDSTIYAPIDSPNFTGVPTAPTPAQGSADGSIATTAFVMNAVADSVTGVASFNGRTGLVVLTLADVTNIGGAPLASPIFTGLPSAPTASPGNNTTQLATTQFVTAAVAAVAAGVSSFNTRTGPVVLTSADVAAVGVSAFNGRMGSINLIANDVSAAGGALLASPIFTGTPQAPTAIPATNTTQIATTAFVQAAVAVATSGVQSFNGRAGVVVLTAADVTGVGGALLASPTFTGTPSAPTAAPATSTVQLATCAFVMAAVAAATAGVASFNGRTGAVTLIANDVSAAGGALLASPIFTGTPQAPTATPGTNTAQLATTAFVSAVNVGVTAFNTRQGAVTLTAADLNGAGGGPYLPLAGGILTGGLTPSPTAGIAGVTLANNALAGAIGEYLTGSGSGPMVPSGDSANIADLVLTAGDWDVEGQGNISFPSGGEDFIVSLSTTSATLGASWVRLLANGITVLNLATGATRFSVASATTVFLVLQASYTSGAPTASGTIRARRMR